MKRVVITGAGTQIHGAVCCGDVACNAGRPLWYRPLDFRDVDRLSIKIGGQIQDFEPEAV